MKRFSRIVLVLLAVLAMATGTALLAQGGKVARRVMTDAEFLQFKADVGVAVPGRNYNVIVDGHGTGLRPPTAEEWEEIRYLPIVADLASLTAEGLPEDWDNSTFAWFPPIGNQDGEGSCTAWATTYYLKTFQEAKEHGWDLTDCEWEGGYFGYPSTAFQDQVFSPDFIYHLINSGKDFGSWYYNAIKAMQGLGAASWLEMPYDPKDSSTWPREGAWREAPLYRNEPMLSFNIETDEGIEALKSLLVGGNLAVIGVNANYYSRLSTDDLWTTDTYDVLTTNHANTIVGYDDAFGPYIEGGIEKQGAFKIANSWGIGSWENGDLQEEYDGFYWISPDVLKKWIKWAHSYENIVGYEPRMIAVFELEHTRRGDCRIDVSIGAEAVKCLNDYVLAGIGYVPFPPNKMAMDVTELLPASLRGAVAGALGVLDGGSKFTGTVTHFSVEAYDDYLSGFPAGVVVSNDTPLATVNGGTVTATVRFPGSFLKNN
jgi:hypothetical protein